MEGVPRLYVTWLIASSFHRASSRRKAELMTGGAVHFRKNIVVFGESGVGKSSLINLIAGRSIATTSSVAKECTFHHRKYELQVIDTLYAIWDTEGLDEGNYGTVLAENAEKNLKQLLWDLTTANGIQLLVYCVKASRLDKTLLNNYNLFFSAICRKKVPIVAVVTGLEGYEEQMGNWWDDNESAFEALNMHFDGHACVTTLDIDQVNSPFLKQRCHLSRQVVLSLIATTCARDRWEIEQDGWVSTALADMRAMFRPLRRRGTHLTPVVALHEFPKHFLHPIRSVHDASPFEGAHLMDVGGSPLLVYDIRDQDLGAGTRFKKRIVHRGADLLIFCTSIYSDPRASRQHAAAFYRSYGGDTRPLLIIVKDALSDEIAHQWWNTLDDDKDMDGDEYYHHYDLPYTDVRRIPAIVRGLPPLESTEAHAAVAKLQQAIQTRSLQPFDVAPTGCFAWLYGGKRPAKLHCRSRGAIHAQTDCLTSSNVWVPWYAH